MILAILGWLAALVALLTSIAMLSDTVSIKTFWPHASAIERMRYLVCNLALIGIAASSGVCLLLPLANGMQASPYEVLLRCALTVFLASKSPCPWWAYIVRGNPVRKSSHVR